MDGCLRVAWRSDVAAHATVRAISRLRRAEKRVPSTAACSMQQHALGDRPPVVSVCLTIGFPFGSTQVGSCGRRTGLLLRAPVDTLELLSLCSRACRGLALHYLALHSLSPYDSRLLPQPGDFNLEHTQENRKRPQRIEGAPGPKRRKGARASFTYPSRSVTACGGVSCGTRRSARSSGSAAAGSGCPTPGECARACPTPGEGARLPAGARRTPAGGGTSASRCGGE